MKLYYSVGAVSFAPHIVLIETGLPFQALAAPTRTHQLADGSDYYLINPLGYVPLLELPDGRRLRETPAILQYLADLVPHMHLAPANGSFERYQLQEWLNFIGTELHRNFTPLFNTETPPAYQNTCRQRVFERLKWVDTMLAGKKFLMGSTFTVADAHMFAVTSWTAYTKVDTDRLPHLLAYRTRIENRPSVLAAKQAENKKR
jgi:glutathione S-transferase